jgi:hypothetical protein
MTGNVTKWQEISWSSRNCYEMTGKDRKCHEVAGNIMKWQEMTGNDRKWQEIIHQEISRNCDKKQRPEWNWKKNFMTKYSRFWNSVSLIKVISWTAGASSRSISHFSALLICKLNCCFRLGLSITWFNTFYIILNDCIHKIG